MEQILKPSTLRDLAKVAWWQPTDAADLSRLSLAATELAGRAYVDNDEAAQAEAEHAIYEINLGSCFAPPLNPGLGVVWSTLMQAKLSAHRREFASAISGQSSTSAMAAALAEMVATWGAHKHPLLETLEQEVGLASYRIWAQNWFGSCYGFSLQLASLVQRTTGEVKKTVLENLGDEFDDAATHDTLRVRFYEKLDLHHSPLEAPNERGWVSESTTLLNLRTGLCNLPNPLWALGAFYTIEANWPPECRRHHAMNAARGFDEATLEYWTTHAFADEQHSSEWLDAVNSTCKTQADREAVLEGATIQLQLRWRMYDAIAAKVQAS